MLKNLKQKNNWRNEWISLFFCEKNKTKKRLQLVGGWTLPTRPYSTVVALETIDWVTLDAVGNDDADSLNASSDKIGKKKVIF